MLVVWQLPIFPLPSNIQFWGCLYYYRDCQEYKQDYMKWRQLVLLSTETWQPLRMQLLARKKLDYNLIFKNYCSFNTPIFFTEKPCQYRP